MKPVTIIIDEDALKARDFMLRLFDAKDDPDTIQVPACGDWESVCYSFLQNYVTGYELRGFDGAKAFVDITYESLAKDNPDLKTLLDGGLKEKSASFLQSSTSLYTSAQSTCPPLQELHFVHPDTGEHEVVDARVDYTLGTKSRVWLDAYIAFSKKWAPRGHYLFHEGAGLFLLSAIARRRIYIPIQSGKYTPLYILFTAETSKFTKSTTMKVAEEVLDKAGMGWLVLPRKMTPQFFFTIASGRIPDDFDKISDMQLREDLLRQLRYCAQRPMVIDEFGSRLESFAASNGVMRPYHDLFLHWDGCPLSDDDSALGSGAKKIYEPYISVLAAMTPENFKNLSSKSNSNLWATGFMNRFVLLTPPEHAYSLATWPIGEMVVPEELTQPLRDFDESLQEREVGVDPLVNDKGQLTGKYTIKLGKLPRNRTHIDQEVLDAYASYDTSLHVMMNNEEFNIPKELHGSYQRFAEKALRVAALLAWMDNDGYMTLSHWIAAQEVAERWRISIHEFLYQVGDVESTKEKKYEDALLRVFEKLDGWARVVDMRKKCGMSTEQLLRVLHSLLESGTIVSYDLKRINRKGPVGDGKVYALAGYPIPAMYADRILEKEENEEEKK